MFNPRDMQKVMKQLGIQQEEIKASEVIIKLVDRDLVIANPQVSKINMMGQETYQIVGKASEALKQEISEDDINIVMQQANCSRESALKSLEGNNGNIAQAILKLQGK